MMYQRIVYGLAITALLAGCNGANVQPGGTVDQQSFPAEPAIDAAGQPVMQASQTVPQATAPVSTAPPQMEALENINNRITLLQEQILQLKVQNGGLAERSQLLLTQFQVLAQNVKMAGRGLGGQQNSAGQQAPASDVDQLIGRLDQQLMALEQLAPALGGGNAFRLATTYSAKRKWILVRYNRLTGESWISEGGSWEPLADDFQLPISEYEIQIKSAGGDAKGYVAARIDNNNGDTWWLNNQQWVSYE